MGPEDHQPRRKPTGKWPLFWVFVLLFAAALGLMLVSGVINGPQLA